MSLTPEMMPLWELRELVKQQADTITALRAENERLRAALEPFACMCSVKGEGVGGLCFKGSCLYWNARAALNTQEPSNDRS